MGILQQSIAVMDLISEYRFMAERGFVPVSEEEKEMLESCLA